MTIKMRSAILSLVLSLAMVLTMMPLASFADESVGYDLWVGSTQVTADSMSGDGWSWNYEGNEKGTLTLTNATITDSHAYGFASERANIYASGVELTIKLEGENVLSAEGQRATDGIAIRQDKLNIAGDGSLIIKPTERGIYCLGLLIEKANVVIEEGYRSIYANNVTDVEIDGGRLEIKTEKNGISCGALKTSNNAELIVNTKEECLDLDSAHIKDSVLTIESRSDDALYADDADVIIENSEVSAKSNGDYALDCYSEACNLIITDSKVIAESNSAFGIYANSIEIKDGSGSISTYVEAKTNSADYPAIYANTADGITLGDGLSIVVPEGGELGSYEYREVTGTTVNEPDGAKSAHVIIQGAEKPEPQPEPEPEPEPEIGAGPLIAKMTASGTKTLVLKWNKISGVDGYDIFFSKCNSGGEKKTPKKVATLKGSDRVSYKKAKLKAKTSYKARVKAWVMKDGKKTYVKTSPLIHAYTSGGNTRYTNPKSVNVKKAAVSIKKGKTYTIKATVNRLKKSKKLIATTHAAKVRYLSSDKSIATVSSKGKITAKSQGSCIIYVYAANGVYKKVNVTVK